MGKDPSSAAGVRSSQSDSASVQGPRYAVNRGSVDNALGQPREGYHKRTCPLNSHGCGSVLAKANHTSAPCVLLII